MDALKTMPWKQMRMYQNFDVDIVLPVVWKTL